ncbi:threonine synthase [Meiothermus taiwanensis]|jgi:threonine synthase|uniref:Threonine synthase n=2 Tax=Meiothermus taiwanensis TaxID=172827 RepID=A0A399DRI1_9DEIN|nr:threonine synthase [Meiothermus taiwanensis]AWR87252.1 threonine synthase [Meiothermus taiwanensis WR-220]KIQ53533.1 threonine synthase [Meiothermus taiwanensis]KZK16884.1 threonine synthase [Meiothermus taiwanensis]RIH74855.1 Threonine synthase [Meiothermus taiwanensis]
MVRYYSTRDPHKNLVSFEEALLQGLAPDGGLYIPERIPQIAPEAWLGARSIAEVGVAVLGEWLKEDIPISDLEAILHDALNFPCPLVKLSDDLYVLELFHGPTLSFKDFGARTMARLMQYFLRKRNEHRIILVATSGDTGSAVADGFAGQENIEVVLLYPKGKVSEVQERQLIVQRPGVRSFAVEGTFDDCQRMVKEAFVDPELAHLPLSSANSINIGRLLPQALYYLWALAQLHRQASPSKISFCVPSGNLGNLTAGILAALMGQPVHRFIAAHNDNHFFPDFLQGKAEAYQFHPTIATLSNAMDVGSPSNFERLYTLLGPEKLRAWVWGTTVSNEATLERMQKTYEATGYMACPHTAVGLEAQARYRQQTAHPTPLISLACAHPAKFPDVVLKALGQHPPQEQALQSLHSRPTQVQVIGPTLQALKDFLL